MEKVETITQEQLWFSEMTPSVELLKALNAGPFGAVAGDAAALKKLLANLRKDEIDHAYIFIGAGTCGLGAGAAKTIETTKKWIDDHKVKAEVVIVGCNGLCHEEPILDVQLPGKARVSFGSVTEEKVNAILDKMFAGVIPEGNILGQYKNANHEQWKGVRYLTEHPFLRHQRRWVLRNCGLINFESIEEYIAYGGYQALAKVLKTQTPDDVCNEVLKSGLRGRGGGGFPTGKKWKFARANVADQKYLICNVDEGDPGAFMDRAVCESDPHRLLEGMMIAAYAIGATKAYIYIRAEYPLGVENCKKAIAQAKAYGLLGKNILGSGFDLEIKIKMGAGAFVCGEETALMHSIEGKRGMPRPRPPYPASSGLFGKPTVINNVETLANITTIMMLGGDVCATVGTQGSKGTKVFALSGMVQRTGLVEIPMGTTIRDIVFEIGGGIINNRKCKGVQIGGPSGGCIPEHKMDIATDYEVLKNFGAIVGSGGLVVLDENTCMVDLAKFFMEFIQKESCGKCIPCREGTKRLLEILKAMTRSRKKEDDIDALLRFRGIMELQKLAETIKSASLCGLGQTAPNPVLTSLKWFREEYEAHIYERRCPSGACKELVGAPCQNACPVGTEAWQYVAQVSRGNYEAAYKVIRDANPFPSACAVCNHPCESQCRAGTTGGEPIAIRTLKRFVVDRVDPASYKVMVRKAAPDAPKVAVIGAGPSGLTAAHQLSIKGYRVTVFEKDCKAGGMLYGAIPEYRLPRERLQKEIDLLMNENTQLVCNKALGKDFTIESLFKDGFKAVYLAMGSHGSRKLGIEGEDVLGVYPGITFLKAFNFDGKELAKGKVGIIGGGNSALDAARVAIRQKAVTDVTIYYRRSMDEMPADQEEIDGALEEGVKIVTLVTPVGVVSDNGKLKAVRFLKNTLGEPDSSGRRKPIPIAGSEYDAAMDTLVVAISEQPETAVVGDVKTSRDGTLVINAESFLTSQPGVFGGGDVAAGPRTVIEAIADGKKAAIMMDKYLADKPLKTIPKVKLPSVYVEPLDFGESADENSSRVHAPALAVDQRAKNYSEVEHCITEESAHCEARRCLRCDLDFTLPT